MRLRMSDSDLSAAGSTQCGKYFCVFHQKCKCMQECFHQHRILITSLLTSWKLTIRLPPHHSHILIQPICRECDTRVMSYYWRVFSVQSFASTFFFLAANLYNYIFHKRGFGANVSLGGVNQK